MPKLLELDDFESCPFPTGRFSDEIFPKYCLVRVEIDGPRNNSKLFQFIKTYSSDKQHFNHQVLTRGVCTQSCFELHEKLGESFKSYQNDNSSLFGDGVKKGELVLETEEHELVNTAWLRTGQLKVALSESYVF